MQHAVLVLTIYKIKIKRILFLLLIIFCFFNSYGKTIEITSEHPRISINKKISILPDPGGSFSSKDVISPLFSGLFKRDTTLSKNIDFYWVRFEFSNCMVDQTNWHLHISPRVNNELYILKNEKLQLVGVNGDYVRSSKSAFPVNPNVIPIQLSSIENTTFFIRINTSKPQEFSPFVNIELRLADAEMKNYVRSWITLAVLVGVLVSLCFYILFQYVLFRDRSFLYFFLAFLSLALYFLAFERVGYAITGLDTFNRFTGNYLALSSMFFYIGFSRYFLDPDVKFPMWHKYLRYLQLFYIAPLILIFLVNLNLFWNFTPVVHIIHIIAFIFLLYFAIKSYLNGQAQAGHYLWANTIFFFFLCLFIYFVIKKPTSNTFSTYFLASSLKIGSFGQVLLFTLAITNRFGRLSRQVAEKQLENEKLEKEQILELQSLVTKTNLDLEKKVEERTAEIQLQKEELIAQAENIEAAYNEITNQKSIIEKTHSQITDSLFYAAMIQQAALPKPSLMKLCFKEHFTIFWPRDIVSGDFYWATRVDDVTLFAVSDCTGHGVPGAFMSMLGISLLNEIVKREGITRPDTILNNLRVNLINALQQESSGNEVRDGMDIALCAMYKTDDDYSNNSYTLDYAGAHNPCYIARSSNNDNFPISADAIVIKNTEDATLYMLKPDLMPISKHFKIEPFNRKTVKVIPGDMIYLLSDGITDQVGGPSYKKYSTLRFRKMLAEISRLNLDSQKDIIEKEMLDWMNHPDPISESPSDQIDDFCVLGIRII